MKKIINKALFYKEWMNVRWITLFTIVMLLYFKVYSVKAVINQKLYVRASSWFNNVLYTNGYYQIIIVFIVIILALVLFIGEKTSETQGLIASMPFRRKEIILNKWIVGVVSLTISFTTAYVFLSLLYVANINSINTLLNPYSDIVKWFFMNTVQYICIFSFMMLIQSIMGNLIVSGIVGGILLLVPVYLLAIGQELVMRITKNSFIGIDKVVGWLNIYSYNSIQQNWFYTKTKNGDDIYSTSYYTDYGLKLFILLILTCLFLYLAYVAYKNRKLEYNLRLIVLKKLEPIFIFGVSVCLGLLAGAICGFGYSNKSLSAFWLTTVIFTIVGYFVSKLLLRVLSFGK